MVKIAYEWNMDDEMADRIFQDYFEGQKITMDDPEVQKFWLRFGSITTMRATKVTWDGSTWKQRREMKKLINEELIPPVLEHLAAMYEMLYDDEDDNEEVEEEEDFEDWVSKH